MFTGHQLGSNRSSRIVGVFVLNVLLSFLLGGGLAYSAERDVRDSQYSPLRSRSSARLAPPSKTFTNDRFRVEGRLGVGSEMLTSETAQGNNAAFGASTRFQYKFIESLQMNAEVAALFSSERYQAQLETDEFANGIYAKRFDVVFKPVRFFQIGAGGVNQKEFLDRPLLLSNRAFPGAYAQANIENGRNGVWVRVGEYIPTSRSFDSDRQEKESLPTLTTLEAKALWVPNRYFQIAPSFTHFTYENLPSVVAYEGNLRGNTVSGQTRPNSVFEYDYRGYVGGVDLKLNPSRNLNFTLSTQLIENLEAPETLNSGQVASISSELHYSKMIFKPILGAFYNEADSSPGAYNKGELGHNNREGRFFGFDVDFIKYNFRLRTRYVKADTINENSAANQFDQTYLAVVLETLYVEF